MAAQLNNLTIRQPELSVDGLKPVVLSLLIIKQPVLVVENLSLPVLGNVRMIL